VRRPLALLISVLLALGPLAGPGPAGATTAPSLAGRIFIDGFPTEYEPDEALFGIAPGNVDEESDFDSAWGPDNDLNQIHVTWDRDSIYVSAEGVIWNNNMIVLFDVVPDRGLSSMRGISAWSRNFRFSDDFRPDLFIATWDGNTSPRLILHQGGANVTDNQVGLLFRAAATFSTSQRGRAMEFAIPWNTFFLGTEGLGVTRTFVPSLNDTVNVFTPGANFKVAGVITTGQDHLGGPDSAPDNTRGHVNDSSQEVLIDNYAQVALDELDDTGLGAGGPDGVADWGVSPDSQVTFKFQPPVIPVRLEVVDLSFDRPAFAPDRGEVTRLRFGVDPPPDPNDLLSGSRTLNVSANVYDAYGRFVRNLFLNQTRTAAAPVDSTTDLWDGRDEQGALVPGGAYVIRVVVEPNVGRATRPVVVVR
jgi:hypothetical protein